MHSFCHCQLTVPLPTVPKVLRVSLNNQKPTPPANSRKCLTMAPGTTFFSMIVFDGCLQLTAAAFAMVLEVELSLRKARRKGKGNAHLVAHLLQRKGKTSYGWDCGPAFRKKNHVFLSTTEISEDKFICFIHQTCFKNMMLEKWKKHFLSTSHCWSKVLMHPWPGLFSRLFYIPAFFVRSKLVPRSKKKAKLGDSLSVDQMA